MIAVDNAERAEYGLRAAERGTPDARENDVETNLVDTIANVLHAAELFYGGAEAVLRQAREHFEREK